MHRRLTYLTLAVVVVSLLATNFIEGSLAAPNAGADNTSTTTSTTTSASTTTTTLGTSTTTTLASSAPVSGFYLDIGGSASLGFQPDGIPHHNGHRTDQGYANDVETLEAKSITLKLRQVGCPGETVQSMLGLLANVCNNLPTTQLSRSVDALINYGNEDGLVTIDLGFNDIRPCIMPKKVNEACVDRGINDVRRDLEYSDPYLGYYLDGPTGPTVASETLTAMTLMNTTLAHAYGGAGIPVANVPGSYKSANKSLQVMANVGTIPDDVAMTCQWTWMCTPPPFGPDDHPNNAGYMIIARAIVATLPTAW
jgi:hypothetical protein